MRFVPRRASLVSAALVLAILLPALSAGSLCAHSSQSPDSKCCCKHSPDLVPTLSASMGCCRVDPIGRPTPRPFTASERDTTAKIAALAFALQPMMAAFPAAEETAHAVSPLAESPPSALFLLNSVLRI